MLELRTVGLLQMAMLLAKVKDPYQHVMIGSNAAKPLCFRRLAHVVVQ